jgi:hypothetical protein
MKTILTIAALAIGLSIPARVQTVPTYTTLTASGSTTAVVYFATSPFQQVRIVNAFATSDLSTGKMTFYTGITPMTVAYTNAAGTSVGVAATNGFTVGTWVLIETAAGVRTNGMIASFGAATNIVFAQGVCATTPGDQIYSLTSPVTLPVGSASVTYTGDALYVGNRGRPVMVRVNGTSACSLDTITGRYE